MNHPPPSPQLVRIDPAALRALVGFDTMFEQLERKFAGDKSHTNYPPHNVIKTGDNSYGVFQINMLGELGSDRREKFELDSNAELLNPVVNAQIALHMTKGGKDWSAWSSVNGKRYQEWYNKYPCMQNKN